MDLTAEGVLDWAHWGLNLPTDFDDKAGVTSQISNYIPLGTSTNYLQYGDNAQGFTWTDGTPDPILRTRRPGSMWRGLATVSRLTCRQRRPTVSLASTWAWNAAMHFEASLSDSSAPIYMDESLSGVQDRRYDIIYSAQTPGQTLRVRYWVLLDFGSGNVTLQAASLYPLPPLSVSQPAASPANVVVLGSLVNLAVQPQGAFPYYYQWQVNLGGGFIAIPNSNTNTLYLEAMAPWAAALTGWSSPTAWPAP